MHNYAQLCTIIDNAFRRRHKGIANKRDPGTANHLSLGSRRDTTFFLVFRRWKNFIGLQSIFSSGNMCRCILADKIVHDKHNNELHWTRVSQNIIPDYAQLSTIMHVHNFPSPAVCPASLGHRDQALLWPSVAVVVLVCSMCVWGCKGGCRFLRSYSESFPGN